jgi:hypothetical protein
VFEKHKERKAELAAQTAAQAEHRAADAAATAAAQADALLGWCIDRTREVLDDTPVRLTTSLPLKSGERPLLELDGAELVEPRSSGGQWQGRSQGVSIRVPGTRSMRYRVGATRGTYVRNEEKPTVIDTGTLTITTKRAVFVGSKQSREWAWAKLTGLHDEPGVAWTAIGVSNRQKVSGVAYPPERAVEVRFYLELGAASGNGTAAQMLTELEEERTAHATPAPEA